jgi:hypothetical protein
VKSEIYTRDGRRVVLVRIVVPSEVATMAAPHEPPRPLSADEAYLLTYNEDTRQLETTVVKRDGFR